MIFEFSVNEVIAIIGLGMTFATTVGGVLFAIWKRIASNHTIVLDRIAEVKKEIDEGDRDVTTRLNEFQLVVAQQYATWAQISDLERKWFQETERLYTGMTKLTERIDRILSRIDSKSEDP